jgi:hypothetical protein
MELTYLFTCWFSFMGKHLLLWVYTNPTWCLWFANDSKCLCCVQSFCCQARGSPSCIECSIVQASKLLGVDTIPLTHVQHKTIHKQSSQKKEFIYYYSFGSSFAFNNFILLVGSRLVEISYVNKNRIRSFEKIKCEDYYKYHCAMQTV